MYYIAPYPVSCKKYEYVTNWNPLGTLLRHECLYILTVARSSWKLVVEEGNRHGPTREYFCHPHI